MFMNFKNECLFLLVIALVPGQLVASTETTGLDSAMHAESLHSSSKLSLDQYLLIESMIAYLKKELAQTKDPLEQKHRKEVLERFDTELSQGVCLALSVLWSYGKRVEDDHNNIPTAGTDDAASFKKTYNTLLQWNKKRPFWKFWKKKKSLSAEEKQNIEKFIGDIILLQDRETPRILGAMKGDLSTLVQDASRGSLNFEYGYSFSGYRTELLEKRLAKIIQPKKINILNLGGYGGVEKGIHALAIYQNSHTQKFYCYDPDSETGEKSFDSIFGVTTWLQQEYIELGENLRSFYDPTLLYQHTLTQITIGVFDFSKDATPVVIPTPEELGLDKIEFFETIDTYGSLNHPLPQWYNDYVRKEFCCSMKDFPSSSDWYGEQLFKALKRGQREYAQMLIEKGANPLKVDVTQITDQEMLLLLPEEFLKDELEKIKLKATEELSSAKKYIESFV